VQIPSLVEAAFERVPDVAVRELPGVVHGGAVGRALRLGQRRAGVRRDRQHVGRTVREEDAGAGVGEEHVALGQVAPRVIHHLERRGDVARRGVVVGAEVGGDAAALAGGQEAGQRRSAVGADDRLGHLDHHLAPQRAFRQAVAPLEDLEQPHQRPRLLGDGDLGQRDDEVRRQAPGGLAEQCVQEDLERAGAARLPLLAHRLDADAEERRQRALPHAPRHFARSGDRRRVLLGVRTRAEAVLEVDAEVFDRLAFELAADAIVHGLRQPAVGIGGEADPAGEVGRRGAVRVQGRPRHRAKA
jgi:hypothetical protein